MREEMVLHFCFLQADDIGLEDCCDAREEGESQANGVDVPGSDAEGGRHGEKTSMDASRNRRRLKNVRVRNIMDAWGCGARAVLLASQKSEARGEWRSERSERA